MNHRSVHGLKMIHVHPVPLTVLFENRLHPPANVQAGKIHFPPEVSRSRICAVELDQPVGEWDEG
jgi:hypothetical protein